MKIFYKDKTTNQTLSASFGVLFSRRGSWVNSLRQVISGFKISKILQDYFFVDNVLLKVLIVDALELITKKKQTKILMIGPSLDFMALEKLETNPLNFVGNFPEKQEIKDSFEFIQGLLTKLAELFFTSCNSDRVPDVFTQTQTPIYEKYCESAAQLMWVTNLFLRDS
jgi:hypothetical protein